MWSDYAKKRIKEQAKSVAFIIVYLVLFQLVVLRVPIGNALSITAGILFVILGLAFFLEGLILGLMPLGERVGVKLPLKAGIGIIAFFGLLLGFGSTLAEPAISALRTAGSGVLAWESPLLYMLLEPYTEILVISIGIGVGIAVALGMFRFYYRLSVKPFIFIIIPILVLLSAAFSLNDNLSQIIGLAWDCGAVTTGAVTVPLVLALGIGVSKASSKGRGTSGGFGIIMLASAIPVLAVLLLGFIMNTRAPEPKTETEFFSPENRIEALKLFQDEAGLRSHAFTHGSEAARRAYFADDSSYFETLRAIKTEPNAAERYLGSISFSEWIMHVASEDERRFLSEIEFTSNTQEVLTDAFGETIKEESVGAVRAVLPLSVLLLLVLLLFLREKLPYKDEVVLGISFTLIGMALLTSGIRLGLANLGGEVGSQLPRAFATEEKFVNRILIEDFDTDILYQTITKEGEKKTYFNLADEGQITEVEYFEHRYNPVKNTYEHIITQKPLLGSKLSALGMGLVLLFALGLGYGATQAEPALNALGRTVEEITVGTIKRRQIVQVVSLGVGIGIVLGISRILFNIPLIWLIVPAYALVVFLSFFGKEDFTAIAWDSGGVTTGPVTVPLVLAMGLSIGSELNVTDGFGVLALASVFPVITVLSFSLISRIKQRRSILKSEANDDE